MTKKTRTRARQASQTASASHPTVVTPAGRPSTATRVRQFFAGSAPVAVMSISKPIPMDNEASTLLVALDLTPSSFTPPPSITSSSYHSSVDSFQNRGRPQFFIGTPPPTPPADGLIRAPETRPPFQHATQPELGSPLALTTQAIAPRVRPRARRAPPPPIKIPTKQSIELQEAVLRTQAAEAEVGLFGMGIGIGLEGGSGGKGGGTPIAVDAFFNAPPIKTRTALGQTNFARSLNSSTSSSSSATTSESISSFTTAALPSPEREARLKAPAAVIIAQNLLLPPSSEATAATINNNTLAVASPYSPNFLTLPPLSPLAALSPLSIGADAPPAPSADSDGTWEFKSWLTPSPLLEVEFAKPSPVVESVASPKCGVDVSALVDSFERRAHGGGQGRSIPSSPFSTTAFTHNTLLSVPPTPTIFGFLAGSGPASPTISFPATAIVPDHTHLAPLSHSRSTTAESAVTFWSQSTGYSPVLNGNDGGKFTPEMDQDRSPSSEDDDESDEAATPDGTPVKINGGVLSGGRMGKGRGEAYKRMGVMFGVESNATFLGGALEGEGAEEGY